MKIESVGDEWIIRVPEQVVRGLELESGYPVTIRPLYQNGVVQLAIMEARGKLPEYTFDSVDWDGVDVRQINEHAIDPTPASAWNNGA